MQRNSTMIGEENEETIDFMLFNFNHSLKP